MKPPSHREHREDNLIFFSVLSVTLWCNSFSSSQIAQILFQGCDLFFQFGDGVAFLLHHLRRRAGHETLIGELPLLAFDQLALFGQLLFQTAFFLGRIDQARERHIEIETAEHFRRGLRRLRHIGAAGQSAHAG